MVARTERTDTNFESPMNVSGRGHMVSLVSAHSVRGTILTRVRVNEIIESPQFVSLSGFSAGA